MNTWRWASVKSREMASKEIQKNEEQINAHKSIVFKVINTVETHGHYKTIGDSKITHSETSAPMYFMYKYHKREGGLRQAISGFNTINSARYISVLIQPMI